MECKTPVALLQEYLVKDGILPSYKLLLTGTGHNPTFEWEVSAKGVSITGRGKSKKEAKHEAAKMLLLRLKGETIWREEIPLESPYEKDIKENAVGALQEYCIRKMLAPRYEIIRECGEGIHKLFVIRCTVSSHSTEAEARSKKQAKHQASQLMLLKLRDSFKDEIVHVPLRDETDHIPTAIEIADPGANLEAFNVKKAIENALKRREMNDKDRGSSSSTIIDTSFMGDYTVYIKEKVLPNSVTLQALVNCDDVYLESLKDPECVLTTILNQVDYGYEFDSLDSKSNDYFLCHLCIKDLHNADFIGVAKNHSGAKRNAVIKALKFMVIMSR